MKKVTGYLPTLDMSIAHEINTKLKGIGVNLSNEALEAKTDFYLSQVSEMTKSGVQYFAAKELAWEAIT